MYVDHFYIRRKIRSLRDASFFTLFVKKIDAFFSFLYQRIAMKCFLVFFKVLFNFINPRVVKSFAHLTPQ